MRTARRVGTPQAGFRGVPALGRVADLNRKVSEAKSIANDVRSVAEAFRDEVKNALGLIEDAIRVGVPRFCALHRVPRRLPAAHVSAAGTKLEQSAPSCGPRSSATVPHGRAQALRPPRVTSISPCAERLCEKAGALYESAALTG